MDTQQHIQNILNAQDLWEWDGNDYTYNTTLAAQRIDAWVRESIIAAQPICEHLPARIGGRINEVGIEHVASIYGQHPSNGLRAIAETFQVSEATASRYVKQAREAGLIEDRRRNKPTARMDSSRLNRVADIYNAHPVNGLTALAETFQVSERTASRYVDQARKAGLVEDRRRNRT